MGELKFRVKYYKAVYRFTAKMLHEKKEEEETEVRTATSR